MKYLLFRLYGPMSSWGDIAVGETRPSFPHPSKSAVIGLIAGALGIKRDEEEKHRRISNALGFSVLVESIGLPLSEYHTTQVPSGSERYCTRKGELSGARSELNTILSTRNYRIDGLYMTILWARGSSEWDLEQIAKALTQPIFVPYLGRKSCPTALPFEPKIVDAVSIVEAIGKGKFMDVRDIKSSSVEPKMLYWDDDGEAGIEHQHIFERRDMPLSRRRWQFDVRKEKHATII